MSFYPFPARQALQTMIIISLILFAAGPGFSEDEPIHIEADRMISQEQENSVVFIGNVTTRQGEITIRSDEMTVYYTQNDKAKPKTQSSQVKKLTCKGNVEITQDDWLGTGKRMDYLANDRKVILTGDAKAWQGQSMVSGKTIIYYLDEKRSIVEKDKTKQISFTINPESDSKKK